MGRIYRIKHDLGSIIKKNTLLILTALFFLVWKMFLVNVLWNERSIPPEPDDSYIYMMHIDSVVSCDSYIFCKDSLLNFSNYGSFDHLSYRLFFGFLGKIVNFDGLNTYRLSFYLGIIILVPVLILFLNSINKKNNDHLLCICLLMLALYNGNGAYHGFFWVVPSFFSLILFFIIFSFLVNEIDDKKFYSRIIVLVLINTFTHSISVYLNAIYLLYSIIISIFKKSFEKKIFLKSLFVCCIGLFISITSSKTIELFGGRPNPYGFDFMVRNVVDNFSDYSNNRYSRSVFLKELYKHIPEKYHISLPEIEVNYFNYVFPNIYIFVFELFVLVLLFRKRKYEILSLYFASFIFVLCSSINQYGYRSLIVLWPITYILFGYGLYEVYFLLKKILGTFFSKTIICSLFAIFFVINIMYSYFYCLGMNRKDNTTIDSELLNELKNIIKPGDLVYIRSDHEYLNQANLFYKHYSFQVTQSLENAMYTIEFSGQSTNKNDFIDLLANSASKTFGYLRSTIQPTNNSTSTEYNGFEKIYSKNDWEIYKKISGS